MQSDWTRRLNDVMPFGSSTNSKAPQLAPDEPSVIVRGQGCRVWDDRDREFIDFRNALGPVTLGYRFPAVDAAIKLQLESGIVFGHPHPLECEVAELLRDVIPCAEQVRFLKTGGESIAACVRLSRAYTGRDHVIQIGYNGWVNALARGARTLPGTSADDAPPGVPHAFAALHHACKWNDIETIRNLFDEFHGQIAAVVVAADYRQMSDGATFYPALRKLTEDEGTVLVFDEIVTGFRIARAGVQEYFKIKPDMAVFAKGIANGMPLSAYCGSRELMQTTRRATVSTTYGGETLTLAAAKAAIETYRNQDVVVHLWRMGETLWSEVNRLMRDAGLAITVEGFWPCPVLSIPNTDLKRSFYAACFRNGLSLYDVPYVNFSHKDADIADALRRFEAAAREVKPGR